MAYFSLFITGFIAATLFPASSELLLLALLQQGYQPFLLWLVATTGNTLGSCVNWWLGKQLRRFQHKRWFPISEPQLVRAERLFLRYGRWSLLLSWLPVIGDPLTMIAGVLKVPFPIFLLLVALGKALRYGILILLAISFF
ncbi:YqaA family protein [Alishewanella tabrizica]|uniref:Membrane protein n=1 Tax=Alishewanella tabrizica TaxID=671278 RepID=A0ABQ2WJ47_9ALTE|nr:YqaA family protein [Alishewanella tabrizica]GGW59197.1 membrane protein [Alishewanella tabrizica]